MDRHPVLGGLEMFPPVPSGLSIAILLFALAKFALWATPGEAQIRRDPDAVAVLAQSVRVMGGAPPADSVATGSVALIAGSKEETGSVRILTRGENQSSVTIQTDTTRSLAYSRGRAKMTEGEVSRPLPLELAVTSQACDFPLPLLAAALAREDIALQYVALETLDGVTAHHLRFWTVFEDNLLEGLEELSSRDLWVDATTGLPIKISYDLRSARGAVAPIPVELFFADYLEFGGVLYPTYIRKHVNGTPYSAVSIDSVSIGVGLSEADFSIQ